MEHSAFHAGHKFYDADFAYILNDAVDDLIAEIAVCHLASAEAERGLHLVAFFQEADGLVLLCLVVVFVYRDGELDFLDRDDLLLLTRCAIALVFLIQILAVILNAADRRYCVGGDLYEVQTAFAGDFESIERGHNTKLLAVLIDHANLACTNLFIGADRIFDRALISKRWNRN